MGKQIAFILPEIDREKTKEKVEQVLEKYRIYLLSVPDEKLPKITASYSLIPPAFTNEFHSSTEENAIAKVDFEIAKEKHIEWVMRAVNKLNFKEREMIIKRYLSEDEAFDYEIYNQLGMSERQFYRFKARTFYKIAFALKIEEYIMAE